LFVRYICELALGQRCYIYIFSTNADAFSGHSSTPVEVAPLELSPPTADLVSNSDCSGELEAH